MDINSFNARSKEVKLLLLKGITLYVPEFEPYEKIIGACVLGKSPQLPGMYIQTVKVLNTDGSVRGITLYSFLDAICSWDTLTRVCGKGSLREIALRLQNLRRATFPAENRTHSHYIVKILEQEEVDEC